MVIELKKSNAANQCLQRAENKKNLLSLKVKQFMRFWAHQMKGTQKSHGAPLGPEGIEAA